MDHYASRSLLALLVPALAAACATAPDAQLRESRASLARALQAGAADLAPGEIALARDKLSLGERSIASGDYKPARWLLEQARVDADLAAAKAETARERRTSP